MAKMPCPTKLRLLLAYDPMSGTLTWKPRTPALAPNRGASAIFNRLFAGKRAFTALNTPGYFHGAINGKLFVAHRVAWSIFYNQQPPEFIDHINGIRTDNRIENLRPATRSQNTMNSSGNGKRPTKFKNVFRVRRYNGALAWRAGVYKDGLRHYGGLHDTPEEAARAADDLMLTLHGEYARLNFPPTARQGAR